MKSKLWPMWICLMVALLGCETPSGVLPATQNVKGTLAFIDIARFDHDLQASLLAPQSSVEVAFYEKVSPNSTPERLQKWLTAVERNGGKIDVEPPPGELVARSPFALISLLGGLWNVIKLGTAIQQDKMVQAAHDHDALISLERNAAGEIVMSKVTFKRKPRD